jgi:hypothetical protein
MTNSVWHQWAMNRMRDVNDVNAQRDTLNPAWVNYVISQLDTRIVELEIKNFTLKERLGQLGDEHTD